MSVIPETLINHILSFRPTHPTAKIVSLKKKHLIHQVKNYIRTLKLFDEYEMVVFELNKLNNLDIESFDIVELQKLRDKIYYIVMFIKEYDWQQSE
jgi:hypothetical protein